MAASVTFTEERRANYQKIIAAVVSGSDGAASGTTSRTYTGQVVSFTAIPASGATAPDNQFDVTASDEDSVDILDGQGANLSNAATTTIVAGLGAILNDEITLAASGMGDSNAATIILIIKQ